MQVAISTLVTSLLIPLSSNTFKQMSFEPLFHKPSIMHLTGYLVGFHWLLGENEMLKIVAEKIYVRYLYQT